MKNFSLKALGAFIFAAGLVVAGVAAPASAATGTISVSSFTAGNAAGFTFSTGAVTANTIGSFDVKIYNNANQPTTFAPVSGCTTFATCKITSVSMGSTVWTQEGTVSGKTLTLLGTVAPNNNSQSHIQFSFSGTALSLSNESMDVVFATGALTAPNTNGNYTASGTLNAQSFVEYTAPVTVTGAPSVVRFFRNYTAMDFNNTTQSSLGQANLNANTFTNSGKYFQGWATTSGGSVAYLDGASYSFASNLNLYAVWGDTPVTPSNNSSSGSSSSDSLANTGINSATGISLLAGGLSLALVGAEMFMIARRKRSN